MLTLKNDPPDIDTLATVSNQYVEYGHKYRKFTRSCLTKDPAQRPTPLFHQVKGQGESAQQQMLHKCSSWGCVGMIARCILFLNRLNAIYKVPLLHYRLYSTVRSRRRYWHRSCFFNFVLEVNPYSVVYFLNELRLPYAASLSSKLAQIPHCVVHLLLSTKPFLLHLKHTSGCLYWGVA